MSEAGINDPFLSVHPVEANEATPRLLGSGSRWNWIDYAALLLVVMIAFFVRIRSTEAGLSFDELWHLGLTKGIGNPVAIFPWDTVVHQAINLTAIDADAGPVWRIWTGMDGVLHPPLYLVLLRLWRDAFGDSDHIAQLLSIGWSLIGIGFTFAAGRLAMNRAVGFLCALSLALAQTQVYFAQEVRSYAMLIALGSVAVWLMTRIEVLGPSRRRLVGLALITLPLQLTHYFAFGALVAIALYGFGKSGRHQRAFIVALAISAVSFVISWLPFAIRQIDDIGTGDAFLSSGGRGVGHVLLLALGTPFRLYAERDYSREPALLLTGAIFFVPWLLRRRFQPLHPWALWICCTIGVVLALDVGRSTVHTEFVRYLAIATPAVPLLFAGVAWQVRPALAYVALCGLTFTGLVYLISHNGISNDAEDLTPIAGIVSSMIAPDDAIVAYAGVMPAFYGDMLMLTASHEPGLFPRSIVVLTQPMTVEAVRQLGVKRLWLMAGPLDRSLDEIIPGGRETYMKVASVNFTVRCVELSEFPERKPTTAESAPMSKPSTSAVGVETVPADTSDLARSLAQ